MKKKILLIFFTLALVFILDYVSKQSILTILANKPAIEITSFFNLILTFNHGVSFSMFQAGSLYGVWMLILLTSALTLVVLYFAWKSGRIIEQISYAMIAGGALGNLFDRLRYHAVVDFLDFHVYGYHWPTFNVADSAICVGVFLLFLYQILLHFKYSKES